MNELQFQQCCERNALGSRSGCALLNGAASSVPKARIDEGIKASRQQGFEQRC